MLYFNVISRSNVHVSSAEVPVRGFWREHDPVDPSVAFGHEDIDETEYVL